MFHFSRVTTKCVRALTDPLLAIATKSMEQQLRTTFILERVRKFPLHKKNQRPPKMKNRHFIYRLVENTEVRKQKPLEVILTANVNGYGEIGNIISIKPTKAYNELLLPKLAVYASPENKKKYEEKMKGVERVYSSLTAPVMMKYLSIARIPIRMSAENPWTIEKYHIKVSFRKVQIMVPDDAIELPEKQISGPNFDLEGNEFYVTITINNKEKVNVRCVVHHDTHDPNKKLPFPPDYWRYPGEPIYPEFAEVLDSMPKNYKLMNEKRPEIVRQL